jgi:hypothetical protein
MDINHLTVEELKIVKDAINQKINQLGDNTSQEETLEEAAFHYSKNKINKNTSLLDFTKGAKWQAERMYSEEIIDILDNVRYWETCPDEYKVIIKKYTKLLLKRI